MIDLDRKTSVKNLSMYLRPDEARRMHRELENLLEAPEAVEHFHIESPDHSREISCSILTETKLKNLAGYNKLEQKILSEE
jgi:hypothetical protein